MAKIYRRTLRICSYDLETLETEKNLPISFDWVKAQAQAMSTAILLAYASDGILWGKATDGHLQLSPPPAPAWNEGHLQELWLFNRQEAWHLWKDDRGQWQALHFPREEKGQPCPEEPKPCCYYDEPYLLWGTHHEGHANGFTRVREGERGLHQAIPLEVDKSAFGEGKHPLCLWVRHYLKEDNNGVLRVFLSRPLCLAVGERCRPDGEVKCEEKGEQA